MDSKNSTLELTADFQSETADPSVTPGDVFDDLTADRKLPRRVWALLGSLPPDYVDDYEKWRDVGFALANEDDSLLDLYDAWSRLSDRYEAGSCERIFEEAKKRKPEKPITLGSLYHWAGHVPRQPKFRKLPIGELLRGDFTIDYLIEGLLAELQPCICAGPVKTCKTTFALNMGLCLAAGKPFLGRETAKRRVAFMSGESGLATLQDATRRMVETVGDVDDGDFVLSPDLPRFDQRLDPLEEWLTELQTQVLIIDPAYLCMDGSEAGNVFVMGAQLGRIAKLCTKLQITLVLLHHVPKQPGRENRPLELVDMAWSGFSEFARQWLMLSRREPYEDGTGHHELYLRAGGSAGHSSLLYLDIDEGAFPERSWKIEARSSSKVRADKDEAEYQNYVAWVQAVVKEPMAKTSIEKAARIPRAKSAQVLERMLAENRLKQDGTRSGQPLYTLAV